MTSDRREGKRNCRASAALRERDSREGKEKHSARTARQGESRTLESSRGEKKEGCHVLFVPRHGIRENRLMGLLEEKEIDIRTEKTA